MPRSLRPALLLPGLLAAGTLLVVACTPSRPVAQTPTSDTPSTQAHLCCKSDDWRDFGCIGSAELVGTVDQANACLAEAGQLLSCPDTSSWTCAAATDGGPRVCMCERLDRQFSIDGYSWDARVAEAARLRGAPDSVPMAMCCDQPDASTCVYTGGDRYFGPEQTRGRLPPNLATQRPASCEATGGAWMECSAQDWRCETERVDGIELHRCRCGSTPG